MIPDNQTSRLLVSLRSSCTVQCHRGPDYPPSVHLEKKDWKACWPMILFCRNPDYPRYHRPRRDEGLDNGDLCTSCSLLPGFVLSTIQELPLQRYGLRYKYSILLQLISPEPWLELLNLWEVSRADVQYEIRFCEKGSDVRQWQ